MFFQFLDAANSFTQALELLDVQITLSTSMQRQKITLLNNRSAMYEKANLPELALADCDEILELETNHSKARPRKLRIYETQQKYDLALREICALQILFMQQHKTQLQMRLPLPPPPIPQSKMEDILNQVLPSELETYIAKMEERNRSHETLPGKYTILQLLKSYKNYNAWMGQAAGYRNIDVDSGSPSEQAIALMHRGMRFVYDRKYPEAAVDFEKALKMVTEQKLSLESDAHARLLEWTGMVRHWYYKLEDAMECLKDASALEPDNALLLVKMAGIQLDAGQQDTALDYFKQALSIDPNNTDALLHRSNLRIMQGQPQLAKADLEQCLKQSPDYTMARLRLAAVLVPMEDLPGAQQQLDAITEDTSEVHSYRGELHFANGEMEDALKCFETAMSMEPSNPTPYVNAAMALLNVPNQMPDTERVVKLLQDAIRVDPQFSAAYVHLGQLQLGMATNLENARKVVELYDQGLENARTPEEIKELCNVRILAVSQVEAATMLGMETFNMS